MGTTFWDKTEKEKLLFVIKYTIIVLITIMVFKFVLGIFIALLTFVIIKLFGIRIDFDYASIFIYSTRSL